MSDKQTCSELEWKCIVETCVDGDDIVGFYVDKSICPTAKEFIMRIAQEYGDEYCEREVRTGYVVKSVNDMYRFVKGKTPKSIEVWVTEGPYD